MTTMAVALDRNLFLAYYSSQLTGAPQVFIIGWEQNNFKGVYNYIYDYHVIGFVSGLNRLSDIYR